MKRNRIQKFLDELSKTSNISIACERVGLSRQTIYRWMEADRKFRKKVNDSIRLGIESINDLAETKLITHIKNGSERSIEYWLDNHKENYFRPRPKEFWPKMFELNKSTQGGCFIIDTNGSIKYKKTMSSDSKEHKLNLKEKDSVFEDMIERYDPLILKFVDASEDGDIKKPD